MTPVSNTGFNNAMTHIGKVAEMTKNQQQVEGQIVMDLISAASAPAKSQAPQPVGNIGHNINTTA
ncbi:cytoplasmic protein [Shewanella corallii]|uniref:Cytoplasmic protein n=1 Tax=Shewanella corallii TaxID=560080 RepID=A0ABT0N329_9GAMM|nr:cytoplasmic protein [Shewanella corallii]MCL2912575.1 cytoplasmic protein [Shewanella corallii]